MISEKVKLLSRVPHFVTPWTVALQASLSMGFSRQEFWTGLPCPSPGIFPTQGLNLGLLYWQADSLPSEPPGKPSVFKSSFQKPCSYWSYEDSQLYLKKAISEAETTHPRITSNCFPFFEYQTQAPSPSSALLLLFKASGLDQYFIHYEYCCMKCTVWSECS